MAMSQADLDAMLANPAAAVAGLQSGLEAYFGTGEGSVAIERTVPDLLGGRRLADDRRLTDAASLEVDFAVASTDPQIGLRAALVAAYAGTNFIHREVVDSFSVIFKIIIHHLHRYLEFCEFSYGFFFFCKMLLALSLSLPP